MHLGLGTSDHESPMTVQTAMVRSVYADSVGFDARQEGLLSRFMHALLMSRSPATAAQTCCRQPVTRFLVCHFTGERHLGPSFPQTLTSTLSIMRMRPSRIAPSNTTLPVTRVSGSSVAASQTAR